MKLPLWIVIQKTNFRKNKETALLSNVYMSFFKQEKPQFFIQRARPFSINGHPHGVMQITFLRKGSCTSSLAYLS